MNFVDHNPPHFHAEYQGHSASFRISTGEVLAGTFPRAMLSTVKQWTLAHQAELETNWRNAQARQPLFRIPGADND